LESLYQKTSVGLWIYDKYLKIPHRGTIEYTIQHK